MSLAQDFKLAKAFTPTVGCERHEMSLSFGRDCCGRLCFSGEREWLVTNGIGGYASGTIAGLLTRRYHGLLVA